ncbi:hypothetical protein [Luteimonas kalidii]|uniref:Uncharacterized protein n=1 Tax=Luteimonas kalidii TaxID=3042025 RepID=A0ABT6JU74_9GAMM|nr:hypothetical protein [Luteimonas kalidii]MDH5834236.1 hypothetical protein [Luteimonas kalidii]
MTARYIDRATLDHQLDELEARLPQLIAETEPDHLMDAFAGIADEMLEHASAEDCGHVDTRINRILHEAGLVPGDDEEPCDDA